MSLLRSWATKLLHQSGADDTPREVTKTDEEWRNELTPAQYRVLRQSATERPFSAEAVTADADGLYRCAGCRAALFRSDTKFDSGTGWPSFSDGDDDALELRRDFGLGIPRTEVLCRACGGHLGHVFRDGPPPTGKRYCINGCALA
jgi:peptide-methionine (R)-S-oxide reductase